MIPFDRWFLPDGEAHLQEWMTGRQEVVEGRLTYQYHKYTAALSFCTSRRRAVDVGAHVGLWSYWMARDFETVDAFEPVKAHRECWLANMVGRRGRARLHGCALGDRTAMVTMTTGPASSGDTYVEPGVDGLVPMVPLDDFLGDLPGTDFLKIDCEGGELAVLRGARQLLEQQTPVVLVEQKPGHGAKYGLGDRDALLFLRGLGYMVRQEISGDFILTRQG